MGSDSQFLSYEDIELPQFDSLATASVSARSSQPRVIHKKNLRTVDRERDHDVASASEHSTVVGRASPGIAEARQTRRDAIPA